MNNGKMPATPVVNSEGYCANPASGAIDPGCCVGLTKREEFAKAAMQGLCNFAIERAIEDEVVAGWAVDMADAVLAELEARE